MCLETTKAVGQYPKMGFHVDDGVEEVNPFWYMSSSDG